MPPELSESDLGKKVKYLIQLHKDQGSLSEFLHVLRLSLNHMKEYDKVFDVAVILYTEFELLQIYIKQIKQDLGDMVFNDDGLQMIQESSNELSAVTSATATATHRIIDATELFKEVIKKMEGPDADRLNQAVIDIYEACSFQDITSQRISKVLKRFDKIECLLTNLVKVIGYKKEEQVANLGKDKGDNKQSDTTPVSDEDLLAGPPLEEHATTQEEIDRILANLD